MISGPEKRYGKRYLFRKNDMQKDIFSEKGAFGRYHKRYQNQKKDMEKDIKTEKKI